jgi:predicted enzyme related to lactoylglutathione lyase
MHISINLDVADKERAAAFWCAALGYERRGSVGQYCSIEPPAPIAGPKFILQEVEEPKVAKNRMHLDLDLEPGEDLSAEVERILALGATKVWGPIEEFDMCWVTLADPDGNEFCVCTG